MEEIYPGIGKYWVGLLCANFYRMPLLRANFTLVI